MAEPLTCDRCMSAPASLLLVMAKDARDQGKTLRAGARVLGLRCGACLEAELPVLERGGRAFTVQALTAPLMPVAFGAVHGEARCGTTDVDSMFVAGPRGLGTALDILGPVSSDDRA